MSDPFSTRLIIGLEKPEENFVCSGEGANVDAMRRAILRGQRDSALIRNVMIHADVAGLSGEDRYVLLAYHALIELQRYAGRLSDCIALQPRPPMIKPEG